MVKCHCGSGGQELRKKGRKEGKLRNVSIDQYPEQYSLAHPYPTVVSIVQQK